MPDKLQYDASLDHLLGECFRLNRGLLDASEQLTEGTGITAAQWGVLTALASGGVPRTVARIAQQMGLARQSVQRVADILTEKGLAKYWPNPDNKRAKLAKVTETGRALLEQTKNKQRAWLNGIAPDSSPEEINAAFQQLKKIRQRME
jgi:DNA-binding MarR family transcriptional regulator